MKVCMSERCIVEQVEYSYFGCELFDLSPCHVILTNTTRGVSHVRLRRHAENRMDLVSLHPPYLHPLCIPKMSFLFASKAPSYADEQLKVQLASLSTLSIAPAAGFNASSTSNAKPAPALEVALRDLASSSIPDHDKLVQVLVDLAKHRESVSSYSNEVDQLVEAEVLGRAVVLVWKEVLQALVEGALQLEEERLWWDNSLAGRQGVLVYLVQSKCPTLCV